MRRHAAPLRLALCVLGAALLLSSLEHALAERGHSPHHETIHSDGSGLCSVACFVAAAAPTPRQASPFLVRAIERLPALPTVAPSAVLARAPRGDLSLPRQRSPALLQVFRF